VDFAVAFALGAIPARHALERRHWKEAATLPMPQHPSLRRYVFGEGYIEYARAIGRARSQDVAGARRAISRLEGLEAKMADARLVAFRRQLAFQIQAAKAWLLRAEGKNDQAVSMMRKAADMEDAYRGPVGPGPIFPAREQLGELLLELNRPGEALAAYESCLKTNPGRFISLAGAGLAAERAGARG
jgi:tetratricopeptide (TPR) repeat protein